MASRLQGSFPAGPHKCCARLENTSKHALCDTASRPSSTLHVLGNNCLTTSLTRVFKGALQLLRSSNETLLHTCPTVLTTCSRSSQNILEVTTPVSNIHVLPPTDFSPFRSIQPSSCHDHGRKSRSDHLARFKNVLARFII